jgi:hypothetical protein
VSKNEYGPNRKEEVIKRRKRFPCVLDNDDTEKEETYDILVLGSEVSKLDFL